MKLPWNRPRRFWPRPAWKCGAPKPQRDLGIHAIAALIGQGADVYADITRPAAAVENALPLPEHLPADLLARRPDILAAHARISAALHGREAAHADFYPNIDLAAAIGFPGRSVWTICSPAMLW